MTHLLIGRLSLTSAAVADVLAWIMLALVVVLADARGEWSRFWQMLLGLGALSAAVLGAGRPMLARLVPRFSGTDGQKARCWPCF